LCSKDPRADYAVVYLEEAHPTTGWMYPAVEERFRIQQHASIYERLTAVGITF
jgi:hypothetical protein